MDTRLYNRVINGLSALGFALLVLTLLIAIKYLVTPDPIAVYSPKLVPAFTSVDFGDSLWSIAKFWYPDKHTGQMVYEIQQLNGITEPNKLKPGQRLLLPEV